MARILNFQKAWEWILSFLRVRAVTGGLEISDQVLRLVYFNKKGGETAAVRLEPGILENGVVKNPEAFKAALALLRSKVAEIHAPSQKINVVVSLGSVNIYSQVFNLPVLQGADLEKAIELNVQMLSPIDIAQAYSGGSRLAVTIKLSASKCLRRSSSVLSSMGLRKRCSMRDSWLFLLNRGHGRSCGCFGNGVPGSIRINRTFW